MLLTKYCMMQMRCLMKLFEDSPSPPSKRGLAYSEAQRLRSSLDAEKAEVLHGDNIEVNLMASTLRTAEGEVFLLPVAFTDAIREGRIHRSGACPQQPLELISGPLEAKAQNWEGSTEPIYWLHVSDDTATYPVYGYGADYGLGYHVTPIITDDAEWLCRCSQCGRELPPRFYYSNTNGRCKGTCKACMSANTTVDRIFHKAMRYRTEAESQLLIDTRHWYEALWLRNLCPRGDYAEWCIGKEDIQNRMRKAIKHKRGSAPRRPQNTAAQKIHQIYSLISSSQEYV